MPTPEDADEAPSCINSTPEESGLLCKEAGVATVSEASQSEAGRSD